MDDRPLRCLPVTDFNFSNFAGYLENDEATPGIEILETPFDQVIPLLSQFEAPAWQANPDFAVVWTQPERAIHLFQKRLEFQPVTTAEILREVDDFCAAILSAAQKLAFVFVPTWTLDSARRGLGMADLRPGGLALALWQMNLRLAENLGTASNIFVLDAQRWVSRAGASAFTPKLWHQAKIPFGPAVFQEAVKDIKAALCGSRGGARKLIVLDLDDTLWGGIVGDVGWENLRLGGHDPLGEAYVDFQRELKAFTRRGLLLGIVSKNEEAVALNAIKQHPEMVLQTEHFAGWRINWQDKAANLIELAAELHLGLQSLVFLDDNPVERARVREALPEVLVPEWPETPMLYRQTLLSLRCFDAPIVSPEDTARAGFYTQERHRVNLQRQAGSLEEWLQGLQMEVTVEPLTPQNLSRAAQLLNKTNQLNLRTRRLSEKELQTWTTQADHHLWTFRVADKYGDSGLTGLVSLQKQGQMAKVVDFILSCRVMGRKVEETMTHWLVMQARQLGASEVVAEYLATPKNKPCLEFWLRSRFAHENRRVFRWETTADYALPGGIRLLVPPSENRVVLAK